MRRGHLTFVIILLTALLLAASALAQDLPARQQPALDPGNTEGLTPAAISCLETRTGGTVHETAHQSWDGGEVPEDFCPHGRAVRLFDLDHYSPDTDAAEGGSD